MIFTNLSDDPTLGECLAADTAKKLAALNRAAATMPCVPSVVVRDLQTFTDSDKMADAHRIALVRRIEAGERARAELKKLGVTKAVQSELDALCVSLSGIPSRALNAPGHTELQLRKVVLLETFIAGLQYHAGIQQEVFERLAPEMILTLKREPENPHDKSAIAIHIPSGQRLGYISRKVNKLLAATMDQDMAVAASIDFIDPEEEPHARVAISVNLCVPVILEAAQWGDMWDFARDREQRHSVHVAERANAQNWSERLNEAIEVFLKENRASVSLLQRHMGIGYTRAVTICEQMERLGIVGPDCGNEKRDLLISRKL